MKNQISKKQSTTFALFVLLLVTLLAFAACTTKYVEPTQDENQGEEQPEENTPPPNTVPLGATLSHKTYGAFTLAEHNIQELTITETEATLEIRHGDGSLTAKAERELTAEEYNSYVELFNSNNFMQLDDLYTPGEGDPLIADTGNLEIWIEGQTQMKKVRVEPNADFYMPQSLQNINNNLLKLKTELYDEAMKESSSGSTPNTIVVMYQPMQCEETPWEKWFVNSGIVFVKEPTQEELITMYYSGELDIVIKDVKEIQTDRLVCEACGVCPTSTYFEATIPSSAFETMSSEGWTEI